MRQQSTTSMTNSLTAFQPSTDNAAKLERKAKRVWVGVIITLLGLQVASGIVTIYLATSDPTSAIIPNYYQSGLNWDTKHRNLSQFTRLGWHVVVEVQPTDEEFSQRLVKIRLFKGELPISKQRISASVYHHARGREIFKLRFDEANQGEYVAICKLAQAGLWELDVLIEGDHGIAETRFTLDVRPEGSTELRYPPTPQNPVES
jgi:nitrogen fixation protein FixH